MTEATRARLNEIKDLTPSLGGQWKTDNEWLISELEKYDQALNTAEGCLLMIAEQNASGSEHFLAQDALRKIENLMKGGAE